MASFKTAVLASLAGTAAARSVPANVQSLYNSIVSQGSCRSPLATGFYSSDGDGGSTSYCGDHLADYGIVYLQGTNGRLANMDIDCDGIQNGPADDGRCGSSGDTQSVTSFSDTVRGYGTGQKDLDANAHPYVVFGNDGGRGWNVWDPQSVGIEPLSVMAVVCNNKLIYGVWGDTNGDDGRYPVVGEASISLATACFGTGVNGNSGHDETDVLYIAFTGSSAVPGARGAQWNAQDYNTFENSITALGDSLVARIGTTGGGDPGNGGGSTPPPSGGNCSWQGHCSGAPCGSDDDCSDDLTCSNGYCGGSPSGGNGGNGGGSTPPPSGGNCSWQGHCAGASCGSDDDCSDDLTCSNGYCGGTPIDKHRILWTVGQKENHVPRLDHGSQTEVQAVIDKSLELGSHIPEPFPSIVKQTDPKTVLLLNSRDKMPFYHDDIAKIPAIFLGDSNHALSPFAGIGANLALVDGWDMANQLCSQNSLEEAVKAYDDLSVTRATRHVKRSRGMIKAAHDTGLRYYLFWCMLFVGKFVRWVLFKTGR